jgi:hypothetical protein
MASVIFCVCYIIVTVLVLTIIDVIIEKIFFGKENKIDIKKIERVVRWAFLIGACYYCIADCIQKVVIGE